MSSKDFFIIMYSRIQNSFKIITKQNYLLYESAYFEIIYKVYIAYLIIIMYFTNCLLFTIIIIIFNFHSDRSKFIFRLEIWQNLCFAKFIF